MTNRRVAGLFGLLLGVTATPALAQDVAGSYEVKFEEMSTNCTPPPVAYAKGFVKVDTAKSSLKVNIETIPQMVGVPAKSGKINAKTTKKVATTVQGLDAKYGISGRVDDNGIIQLVLVAEYTRQDNGKPHCTQSWNVTGVKKSAVADEKPAKPKSALELFTIPL